MAWKTSLVQPTFGCVVNCSSPIAVLGIPLDVSGTYRPGTRFAPQKIREATCNLELYSYLTNTPLEDLGYKDFGDLNLPPGDTERSLELIKLVVKCIREEHKYMLLILGGEHLLTYPALLALRNDVDTVIVFDAHLDLRYEYLGSRLNHATFLRRVVEAGFKVIHIGSRAYSKEELEFVKSANIEMYNVSKAKKGDVKLGDLGRVYVSIDIDVLDPSIAPGVSNPEPLGLDLETLLKLLARVFNSSSEVVAVDITEVNPLVDASSLTSIVAAKIGIEVSGLYASRWARPR